MTDEKKIPEKDLDQITGGELNPAESSRPNAYRPWSPGGGIAADGSNAECDGEIDGTELQQDP